MRSAVGLTLPMTAIHGSWFHVYTTGRPGRALRMTRPGAIRPSGHVRTRFNPGDLIAPGFETLYLALDPDTARFEKRALAGDPYGDPTGERFPYPRMARTAVVAVEIRLEHVLDLTALDNQALLGTTAQELTGDWEGYERRGRPDPGIVLTEPTGIAPTQQLGWELFGNPKIEGIKAISAKVTTTCSLVVFTHKLSRPGSLMWDDPNTGQRETYPEP